MAQELLRAVQENKMSELSQHLDKNSKQKMDTIEKTEQLYLKTSVWTLVFIKCMTGSKQTHIFKRKSGKLVTGRVHGTTEIKYDIDFGIDDMEF